MSCTATTTSYGLKKGATSSRQLDLEVSEPQVWRQEGQQG